MVTFDTSALVRFFTNDIPVKASQVKRILESKEKITIPDIVFPELEYVLLSKSYNATRKKILEAFEVLITRRNVSVSSSVRKAVEIYRRTNLDMADCLIVAHSLGNRLLSFDKKLLTITGVKGYKIKNQPKA